MSKHFQIGVTGGIGAGKSIVTKILSIFGIPVYDSDAQAKELMSGDKDLISAIISAFGEESYREGKLNRPYLAANVFRNPEQLVKLNNLVHPRVAEHYADWSEKQSSQMVIKEAALLYEAGTAEQLDYVIVVSAPAALRINRVVMRDNRTEEQIREIMARQWPQEKLESLCDRVIQNDEVMPVIPQVVEVYEDIKRKASLC